MRPIRKPSISAAQHDPAHLFIALKHPRPELIARIKAIPGRRWIASERRWSVPDTPAARDVIEQIRQLDSRAVTSATNKGIEPAGATIEDLLRRAGEEMALRRFSMRTRRAYLHHVRAFLNFTNGSVQHEDQQMRLYLLVS